jgi:hypothetical protein
VATGDSIHTVLIPDGGHFASPEGSPLKNHFHEGDTSLEVLIYKDRKTVEVQERATSVSGSDDVIVHKEDFIDE